MISLRNKQLFETFSKDNQTKETNGIKIIVQCKIAEGEYTNSVPWKLCGMASK